MKDLCGTLRNLHLTDLKGWRLALFSLSYWRWTPANCSWCLHVYLIMFSFVGQSHVHGVWKTVSKSFISWKHWPNFHNSGIWNWILQFRVCSVTQAPSENRVYMATEHVLCWNRHYSVGRNRNSSCVFRRVTQIVKSHHHTSSSCSKVIFSLHLRPRSNCHYLKSPSI